MRMEIKSAASFLANLLRLHARGMQAGFFDMFRGTLEELLRHHYQHHWFPEKPCKGSGYRCLRINHKMDPLIAKAGCAIGLDEASLRQMFPNELTMWIDPREVSYRIGENGSICVLYDGSKNQFSDARAYDHHPSASYAPTDSRYPGCKESVRGTNCWDGFLMDPRNLGIEQLTAYASG